MFAVKEEALLLTNGSSSATTNLAKVLRFFGVSSRVLTTADFLAYHRASCESCPKYRLLCSSDVFSQLIGDLEQSPAEIQRWKERVHSVFVHAGNDREALQKLARILARDDGAALTNVNGCAGDFVVSDRMNDLCGVMGGLGITASKADVDADLILNTAEGNAINVISLNRAATFVKLEYHKVPVLLSTSKSIIDIDAVVPTGIFDIRDHISSALPTVLYIKWAFARSCWTGAEANTCLVIDDPVLKPTHGFVDFDQLLFLMKRHRFSTSIAFIPWNWRRSAPEVIRLFRQNPENYSISVHGCDHTRAEFGSSDRHRLHWQAKQALERMNHHESKTGFHHDRVMVFPQGVFSQAAMKALKHTDFVAAVNNDTISVNPNFRSMTISDLWDVAVMSYDNFPIFTRRYPWEGVENFAFDILLGKPAIIVIHHDYCSDHCSRLVSFIERLNALKWPLKWGSLGEAVRRSCRQRELSPTLVEVEMYGRELRLENQSGQRRRYLIRKRESKPSSIKEICADSRRIAWNSGKDCIDFETELNPGQGITIQIRFHELIGDGQYEDKLPYRAKAVVRRYLSELRDNYITPAKFRFAGSR